jgi:hypothetical protein
MGWTDKPPPPDAAEAALVPVEESINVAFDEDVVIADRQMPTSPRIRAASPVDEEDTEVKQLQRKTGSPPARPTRR